MKYFLVLTMTALVACGALAGDDAQKLLEARRADDVIQFSFAKTGDGTSVTYRVDNRSPGVLHDGDTFAVSHTIDLSVKDFNPFRMSVTSSETAAADPSQEAVGVFLNAFTGSLKSFVPTLPTNTGGGIGTQGVLPTAGTCKAATECRSKALAKELQRLKANEASAAAAKKAGKPTPPPQASTLDQDLMGCNAIAISCQECASVITTVGKAVEKLNAIKTPAITASDVESWVSDANGLNGIRAVRSKIAGARNTLQTKITAAEDAKKNLEDLRGTQNSGCSEINALTYIQLFTAAADLSSYLDAGHHLLQSMDDLIKMLDGYTAKTWRTGDSSNSDLVFRQTESALDQEKPIALTFRINKYEFDKTSNTIKASSDTSIDRKFLVRRYRRFVNEVGVAGIYNSLKYPTYTAQAASASLGVQPRQASGFTVVRSQSSTNVDAALTLNFLCNYLEDGVYTGFQVGVSKAKDYPGLLAGLVLRFSQPTRLAVSVGGIVTRYKDLSKLVAGGDVASPDALQADLKYRTSPVALYLGVQYNF
ncbi:MAG TPA: hypothetical protein VLC46_25320 [Thermoanaerobaculia bacterium]|jgi:hypothetical protein|nr:hypothetical protein [Thermoanaerobaculia bacterium]